MVLKSVGLLLQRTMTELLCTFVELASDQVFSTLSPYDVHNLACTHASLAAAIDARPLETVPRAIDVTHARMAVDEARLALRDEPDIMHMLHTCCAEFKRIVKRFVLLNARRLLTRDIIEEIRPELCYQGTWCGIEPYVGGITLFVELMRVRVAIGASIGSPPFAMLSVTGHTTEPCELHPTWNRSLALAYALMELTDLPVPVKNVRLLYSSWLTDQPLGPTETILRNVIEHARMTEYTGIHDEALNALNDEDDYM